MSTIEAVLEKVRKLRRLATSSNEHEAAAAAAAAERIIAEHNLSEAALDTTPEQTEKPAEDATPIAFFERRAPFWKRQLAASLTHSHGCSSYLVFGDGSLAQAYVLIGRPSDVATVRYLFTWLVIEIDRLALANGRGQGRAWANSYRMGCVSGIYAAILEAQKEAKESVKSDAFARGGEEALAASCQAIVRVDRRQKDAEEERNRLHPKLGKATGYRGAASNYDAYDRGKRDGRAIHTGGRIGAGNKNLLTG